MKVVARIVGALVIFLVGRLWSAVASVLLAIYAVDETPPSPNSVLGALALFVWVLPIIGTVAAMGLVFPRSWKARRWMLRGMAYCGLAWLLASVGMVI